MKILFLSDAYKSTHHILIQGICEALEQNGHVIETHPEGVNSCDSILVLNRKKLKQYVSIFKSIKVPVFYLLCYSDLEREYTESDTITQTIIFKDIVADVSHFTMAFCVHSDMLLPHITIPSKKVNKEKKVIYVNIDTCYLGELTFLKLLPVLNRLTDCTVFYQSKAGVGRHWLNKHIQRVSDRQDVQELISKANLVIGSGFAAYSAIRQQKKTIVVGERGFGGIVTAETMAYHLSCFFQGRNGGKLDEYIPFPLLVKAIGDEIPNVEGACEQLLLLQKMNETRFIGAIEAIVSNSQSICINDASLTYIINPMLDIIKIKNRLWIVNRSFLKQYKYINESEAAVILSFSQATQTVADVLSRFSSEYQDEIREYIEELIAEKILVPKL
jgi:hypothetical protein